MLVRPEEVRVRRPNMPVRPEEVRVRRPNMLVRPEEVRVRRPNMLVRPEEARVRREEASGRAQKGVRENADSDCLWERGEALEGDLIGRVSSHRTRRPHLQQ